MTVKNVRMDIKELDTQLAKFKGLKVTIGRVIEEDLEEPLGPTPYPSITDLRDWDHKLLKRYPPFYLPFCDVCCLCTFGKCDLSQGKRGACGLDMAAQQSRIVLLAACIGAATHNGHARHLVHHLIEKFGGNAPLNVGGDEVDIDAPVSTLVTGIRPKTLRDLEVILDYTEEQVTHLLSCCHTGMEGDNLDFESKVLHAGMVDQVGMEIADLAQISAYNFPRADPEAPLTDIGWGVCDTSKPVILVIGHNVPPAAGIIDYLLEHQLYGQVEVAGICCTAIDMTRYNAGAKIVGPISWQLRFIRSGIPDVIVVDEQCIRTNLIEDAQKIGAPFIAASEKNCQGLEDRTNDPADEIVEDLVEGRVPGVLILDPEKVGEVTSRVAVEIAPKRRGKGIFPSTEEIVEGSKSCQRCLACQRACPNNLPIPEAVRMAAEGDLQKFASLYQDCVGCARCESACPVGLPLHSYIMKASEGKMAEEKYKIRTGRGAVQDIEIRRVGGPIVLGEIPGVVALVGCANYPHGGEEVAEMAEEFAKRNFIVTATGCAAMSMAMVKDEEGQTLYEKYPGSFDAGGVLNIGSCVSNPHIAGAAIKIARIFAKRNLRANYEEIADYIHNRVGAVGVAWGAMSQKAASIASGFWRLGVPVIVGPHGIKYRRMLMGRREREEDWYVYDARTGEKVYVGPVPEHLFYAAETKEEAIVLIAKLAMRANDTTRGRAIKLTHWIDLHRRLYGTMPEDLHLYVRRKADIPLTMRDEIMKILEEKGWQERETPDPTLLERMIRKRAD
jgi:acetyl-CoA decarbonylase/synthase complex subunit alpha